MQLINLRIHYGHCKNKFLISIDNYRQALQQQYLEGKKNTSGSSQDQLNDTWAKTFIYIVK